MSSSALIERPRQQWGVRTLGISLALLLGALLYRFARFSAEALAAIRYPWEIDYGEGIVWQQMRWMFTPKAYGPIDQFPAIVFHYPPLYHLVSIAVSKLFGADQLASGRAVSVLSTFAAAVASALLVGMLLEGRTSRSLRWACSVVAALLVFTNLPVIIWAPLMRVDMLAIALSLFGLVAAFKSLRRPALIHLAALLFVAALYTKQTSIAAPAATFMVLLALRPKLALQGIATSTLAGLVILGALSWLTDGGFYRHIFFYNVNRFDLTRLSPALAAAAMHMILLATAIGVLVRRLADLKARSGASSDIRRMAGENPADIQLLITAVYLLISTVMLLLLAKSGASVNYFLEWFFALGLLAAQAPAEASNKDETFASLVSVALAVQVIMVPSSPVDLDANNARSRELAKLSKVIAATDKPVISDDMVLLIRSGRDVLWESAIFAELASTGVWDQRPFVGRIRRNEFAYFLTREQRGTAMFDARYTRDVADAMDEHYPVKQKVAGLVIHRPRSEASR